MEPVLFDHIAMAMDFIDREKETALLASNFKNLTHTIVISPRQWGKTSIVRAAANRVSSKKQTLKICQVNLLNVHTEENFYISLATGILKATSSTWEEMVKTANTFLPRMIPRIVSMCQQSELSFGINLEELKKQPEDVLNFAESVAKAKKIHIVICISEFQHVSGFKDSLSFQKTLLSHWRKHDKVVYCLCGSKRHVMSDLFNNPSMPFYTFGDILLLPKISTANWIHYIRQHFSRTRKEINENDARLVVSLADNHSHYVPQLTQQVWLRTTRKCNKEIVMAAHEGFINQLNLLFINITENLATTQINFLKAVLSGEKQFTSQHVLHKYQLGSSGNIKHIKQALIEREIIDITDGKIEFQDPMYRYWLKKEYFGIYQF